ncbi:hypothetical protein BST65_09585 [Bradyrhizobium canariense]|nr:hypothetical protein BST65_09585 [Bradyrhizobium canariense]OSI37359.1 hypothetical protein BST66_03350 [Bradyrhizobium canariense]OSI52468.1 hypothetical protein BSZ20_03825 [Bradyrhizobium canariense]OSI56488.1 hypothetical protein BST67_03315 [Bradyrhizobium canariense]OSI59509.1 hypothetical protein BSZ15_04450 [Bradyrhizobium canariense]
MLIASFIGALYFLLWRSAEYLIAYYHIGVPQHRGAAVALPVCVAMLLGSTFIFAGFNFGYFVGFYLFSIVAGYLWINRFSVFDYDQAAAFWLMAFSLVLFLIPALATRKVSIEWRPFVLPKRSPEAILIITTGVLVVCSFHGFYLVGIEGMIEHRDDIVRSAGMNYIIGNMIGGAIPFAFACFIEQRRWAICAVLIVVTLLYYPVTLTKTVLFAAPFLVFVAVASRWLTLRQTVVVSLLVPLMIGVIAIAGVDWEMIKTSQWRWEAFMIPAFRFVAFPSLALEHYLAFFHDHPLTHFCQIGFLKRLMACPYNEPLAYVMARAYDMGRMNASLLATEGIASVGPVFAPLVSFACGIVFTFANLASAHLPARFVLISGAMIPVTLLNVPLSIATTTNGFALLILLWLLSPSDLRLWRSDKSVS